MEKVDTVIIGAGVIGLAIARQLGRLGRSVFVLEQNDRFGEETSSRNSEVIRAGIYYPSGSLKAVLCSHGNMLLYAYCGTRILSISSHFNRDSFLVTATTHGETCQFLTCELINAAGPGARSLRVSLNASRSPSLYYCKGHYYSLQGLEQPFRHLIYPVPKRNNTRLGIHATLDISGQTRFGPDTGYINTVDYRVPAVAPDSWYTAIRRYWPALPDGALQPDYSGIRPKLQRADEAPRDFMIRGCEAHGLPGLVNLFGIESPGLTASLALAGYVESLLVGKNPREQYSP